jgi:hypothetical protein
MNIKIVKTVVITLLVFLSASPLLAKDSIWNLTLTTGEIVSGVVLRGLETDSLVVSNMQFTKRIAIDSISVLRNVKKSNFWKGSGMGLLVGTGAGVLLGLATYEKPSTEDHLFTFDFGPEGNALAGALLGAPIGFVTGGIIGIVSGKDKIYDLSDKSHDQKLETIRMILAKEESRRNRSIKQEGVIFQKRFGAP